MNEWREDLKGILSKATQTEQHAVFLFTDTQVLRFFKQHYYWYYIVCFFQFIHMTCFDSFYSIDHFSKIFLLRIFLFLIYLNSSSDNIRINWKFIEIKFTYYRFTVLIWLCTGVDGLTANIYQFYDSLIPGIQYSTTVFAIVLLPKFRSCMTEHLRHRSIVSERLPQSPSQ